MNGPWTLAGMPAITVPAGQAANGLPLGLQCVGAFGEDAQLITTTVRAAHDLERIRYPWS